MRQLPTQEGGLEGSNLNATAAWQCKALSKDSGCCFGSRCLDGQGDLSSCWTAGERLNQRQMPASVTL